MRKTPAALLISALVLFCAGCGTPQDPLWPAIGASPPRASGEALLDHLAGDWVLTGALDGKPATHDIGARWVLNHEYLTLHEVSRDRSTNGAPNYEAIILISDDESSGECRCLWLDTTAGTGLSNGTMGRGKATRSSIKFEWNFSKTILRNNFVYSSHSDTWQWTIETEQNGKHETFGQVTLRRK